MTPGLFNAKALGRISPVGNFTNFNQSVEYFFGLSGTQSAPSYQYFDKAELVSFSSDCPEVASSTVWFSTSVKPPGKAPTYVSSLKQVAFWRFDESGAVLYYDAYIPNLKAFTNTIGGLPRTDSVLPVMSQQQEIQYLLCPSIQSACTGPNQQYTDVADCVSVLNTKDYGDFGEAWGDYIVCRTIHVALALIDPVVSCLAESWSLGHVPFMLNIPRRITARTSVLQVAANAVTSSTTTSTLMTRSSLGVKTPSSVLARVIEEGGREGYDESLDIAIGAYTTRTTWTFTTSRW